MMAKVKRQKGWSLPLGDEILTKCGVNFRDFKASVKFIRGSVKWSI